jgi:hypothetical protein
MSATMLADSIPLVLALICTSHQNSLQWLGNLSNTETFIVNFFSHKCFVFLYFFLDLSRRDPSVFNRLDHVS